MLWLNELKEGDVFDGELLVTHALKGVTDSGKDYFNLVLSDKTDSIDAKKWDATLEDSKILFPGNVVYVEGKIYLYKGQKQMKIAILDSVDQKSVDLSRFKKCSPIPQKELEAKLDYYLNSFKDPDIALITNTIISRIREKYVTYPAAVRIHHEFASGIIHHSLAMADLAEAVAKLYPSVDRDLLVAGAILHDAGKTVEYENTTTPKETTEGRLIGHISIMYGMFKQIVSELDIKSEVPLLLEHMILAHHGQLEFGSPVLPSTREALLLSMIDMLDSRMMILDKALDPVEPGNFTDRVWAIDNVSFYKPKKR